MASIDELIVEADKAVVAAYRASQKWFNRPARPALTSARVVIDALAWRLRDQAKKTNAAEDRAYANVQIGTRIQLALDEMQKTKDNRKSEKPFAIVLSPYQAERLKWTGKVKRGRGDNAKPATYSGVPIYTAKGVYGPLVLTEDGFNGLTRQAPELLIKAF